MFAFIITNIRVQNMAMLKEFETIPNYNDQVFKIIVNSQMHINLGFVFNIITNFNLSIFPAYTNI